MTETVGPLLRAARETLGQTLEEIEAVTHIRARHLAALEADDYAALPSPAQARGFLKNYAQHLGLDLQDMLGLYEASLSRKPSPLAARPAVVSPPAATNPGQQPEPGRARSDIKAAVRQSGHPTQVGVRSAGRPSSAPSPTPRLASTVPASPRRRLFSADLLVALVILVMLAALLVWGGLQLQAAFAPTATPTLGAPTGAAGTPSAATATLAPEPSATAALPTAAASYEGVNITVRAEQRTWVSVSVDGQIAFAGLMPPGEAREFIGQSVVEVLTGNGLGTRVIWNGADQGLLGQLGQVVTRLWTLEGMVIPTPTATPAVTAAPVATE